MTRFLTLCVFALTVGPLAAADPIIFTNCTIYTCTSSEPIIKGVIVVNDGKIVSVLDLTKIEDQLLPKGKVVDLGGAVVIPGLVDTHSHIGIYPSPVFPPTRTETK